MLALASTRMGNGLTSLAFALMTAAAIWGLFRIKRLPGDGAKLKRVQLLAWVLTIVMLFTLPLALESFFRIWDPSYVYNGS